MAKERDLGNRELESYVDTGFEKGLEITMGLTGVVTTVTLPDEAKGFKLFCSGADIYFAVNATVESLATSALATIPATAFSKTGIALEDFWEVRLLPSGIARTLTMKATIDNPVVLLEVF
ncbi:MAG: hypothetical protein KKC50_08205 [Candidatus Omnitrophica bacterium]|nr:hypothetical protein [Candidatus Omnitrophota bacterium]